MRGQTDLKSMKKGVIWFDFSAEREGQSDCAEV